MKIYYFPKFARNYKKLSSELKARSQEAEALFRTNPFNEKLKTHKLQGSFAGYWAFSIDERHRIVFEFYKKGIVLFHDIGDHGVYR